MIDASPQGGRDFELMLLNIIQTDNLAHLHHRIEQLQGFQSMPLQDRIDQESNERDAMDSIRNCVMWHTAPPVLLGTGHGRSTLALKFHAFLHAIMLIAGHGFNLQRFVKSIHSWVTDYGTEVGFADIKKVKLSTIFPYLSEAPAEEPQPGGLGHAANLQEVDFAASPPEPEDEGSNWYADVEAIMSIPGLLHIIHNAFKDLPGSMTHCSDAILRLSKVAQFLSRKESKERFIATCFQGRLGDILAKLIKEYKAAVYEERWGTVSNCILMTVPLEDALRSMWVLDKYMGKSSSSIRNPPDEDDSHNVRVDLVDEAITSPLWWAYIKMLAKFAYVQVTLLKWAESCPCHWGLPYKKEEVPRSLRKLWDTCPMRGRRAAELANGDFMTTIQELFEETAASLMLQMPRDLSADDRYMVVQDFERGRCQLLYTFTLKMTHWSEPPWLLCGIAHHQCDKAIATLEKVLSSDSTHPAVLELREPMLWSEICTFCSEPALMSNRESSMPLLRALIAKHCMAFTAERRIEGKHAATQRGVRTAPHHSVPYISLEHRQKEIREAIRKKPEFLSELAGALVNKARSPRLAVKALGLATHPACRDAQGCRNPIFVQVIYRADPWTKYLAAPPSISMQGPGSRPGPVPFAADQAEDAQAFRHKLAEQDVMAEFSREGHAGRVYSMPHKPEAFRTLRSLLLPLKDESNGALCRSHATASGVRSTVDFPDVMQHSTFFQVTRGNKSMLMAPRKRVEGEETLKGNIAVTVHDIILVDNTNCFVAVSFSPMQVDTLITGLGYASPLTISPTSLSLEALESIRTWEILEGEVGHPDFPHP